MNGLEIELGGERGSRLATVAVQGLTDGRPVMVDVGVVVEDPRTGEWEVRALEGGNTFCDGLRFADFLTAVECVAKG